MERYGLGQSEQVVCWEGGAICATVDKDISNARYTFETHTYCFFAVVLAAAVLGPSLTQPPYRSKADLHACTARETMVRRGGRGGKKKKKVGKEKEESTQRHRQRKN